MPVTKAVSLTEEEIIYLIQNHGIYLTAIGNTEERLERINYLHKRLKAFSVPEITEGNTEANVKGWPNAQS